MRHKIKKYKKTNLPSPNHILLFFDKKNYAGLTSPLPLKKIVRPWSLSSTCSDYSNNSNFLRSTSRTNNDEISDVRRKGYATCDTPHFISYKFVFDAKNVIFYRMAGKDMERSSIIILWIYSQSVPLQITRLLINFE